MVILKSTGNYTLSASASFASSRNGSFVCTHHRTSIAHAIFPSATFAILWHHLHRKRVFAAHPKLIAFAGRKPQTVPALHLLEVVSPPPLFLHQQHLDNPSSHEDKTNELPPGGTLALYFLANRISHDDDEYLFCV